MALDTLVLMYHAVPGHARSCAGADAHYSVERVRFVSQLKLMQSLGLKPRSVRDLLNEPSLRQVERPLALTFDDGHDSNFGAFAEIARMGGTADLFINPSTVGTRGFLSWAQLRELAAQGASIQSHGQRHVFLDGLSPEEVRQELALSRRRILDELGKPPTLFAPPNGRMPSGLLETARSLRYAAICTSRVGLWSAANNGLVPRFAVLASTSDTQLKGWLTHSALVVARARVRAEVLDGAKRLLGNGAYMALRRRLLPANPQA
jgi:peptidoglycan/xylan/chitin deacetylase (PgdA/CDA1 family)